MDMISLRRNLMASDVLNLAEYTVTGNPVSFTTQIAKPVKSITIPLSYTQEGTDDPSPSNVRPISGVSSFTFTHNNSSIDVVFPALGKNLCNTSVDNTVPFEYSGYGNYTISNGTVHITGNTLFGFKVPVTALTKYRMSFNKSSDVTIEVFDYAGEPDEIRNGDHTCYYSGSGLEGTITVPNGSNWIVFAIYTSKSDVTISNIQIELGETKTAYEPYTTSVYGGSLDLVSGVLTLTYQILSTTWGAGADYKEFTINERRRFEFSVSCVSAGSAGSNTISNIAPYLWEYTQDSVHFYNNNLYSYMFLPIGTSDSTELQIVGKLAEPITIQLDPHATTAIKGTNTVWTDTAGDLTIKYLDKA